MLPVEYHLLPAVKRTVARGASVTRGVLILAAALAVAELVLLPLHLVLPGIACGMASSFLLGCGLALLVALGAWCHAVLLAGQGMLITRWLLRTGAVLAPLVPVCWGYTFVTGRLLLYRQAELPLILGVLLAAGALFNIPRMAAAPWQLQLRVVLLPLVLLVGLVCDFPGMLLLCAAARLLAAWLAAAPLRLLAALAPRIISMPEKE